jgi:UDP-2,3-diacylglucosamine pyrophosphatase LpxH
MKKVVLKYRTIVLSDVHLGAPDCQIGKVNFLLRHSHAPRLILNGDIIDCWSLRRKGGWNRQHTRFIRLILKKLEKKKNFEVIYLRGNHDDLLDQFLPFTMDNLRFTSEYLLETEKGRYLVVHGDCFDAVTQNTRFIAVAGDIGYQTLLRLNRYYNRYRKWRGKDYFSLAKVIKSKVKKAVSYISRFEDQAIALTKRRDCIGFICGHIHTPDNKMIGDVHYLNSGDWVESNTALVENLDGTWEILEFDAFYQNIQELQAEASPHSEHATDFGEILFEEDPDFEDSPLP